MDQIDTAERLGIKLEYGVNLDNDPICSLPFKVIYIYIYIYSDSESVISIWLND